MAIVGDSYAQGFGDWLLVTNAEGNSSHDSTGVIHDLTGLDVVTFGLGGAGSIDGLVRQPIRTIKYIDSLLQFEMGDPAAIVVYFYEGNDLLDNLNYLRRMEGQPGVDERLPEPVEFQALLASLAKEDLRTPPWFSSFILSRLLLNFFTQDLPTWTPYTGESWQHNRVLQAGQVVAVPDKLQSPALALDHDEIEAGVYVFEQSLMFLTRHFADSEVMIVYLPSPLSSYTVISEFVDIQTYGNEEQRLYPAASVAERSDAICAAIEAVSRRLGARFLDARKAIREAAADGFVHGPQDWKHFNELGYAALGTAVAQALGNHYVPAAE